MPRSSANDNDLVNGCLSGDKRSWDVFVEKFSRLIYWSIRQALLGSGFDQRQELADEIFQEVFERLLEKEELDKLRESTSIRKFLSVMACNRTMNKMRNLARFEKRTRVMDDGMAHPDAASNLDRKEKDLLVAEVVGQLTEREQNCLDLYYLNGKTQAEISSILDLPQTTVANIIWRTRERLKERFIEKGLGIEE